MSEASIRQRRRVNSNFELGQKIQAETLVVLNETRYGFILLTVEEVGGKLTQEK